MSGILVVTDDRSEGSEGRQCRYCQQLYSDSINSVDIVVVNDCK